MGKKLGIGVIHGMGTHEPDFADAMIKEIDKRLLKAGKNPQDVAWQPIHWSDILDGPQSDYFGRIKSGADVDYVKLRKFIIKALGDASGYQKVPSQWNNTYKKVHERIRDNIKKLRDDVDDNTMPLVILAHSLGGHMMSNYIYDIQEGKSVVAPGENDFEKFMTFAGFITFGCTIPLFTFAYNPIVPIKFPVPEIVGTPLGDKARWDNYYDPDDILGYPLKLISNSYDGVVDADFSINVGGIAASWNPASHLKYWTDNDFTKPVSRFLAGFLPGA